MLNNIEAPMHDTTNTFSCDCGVRATVQNIARVSEAVRGTVEVVTSLCADEMAGVVPTSTSVC